MFKLSSNSSKNLIGINDYLIDVVELAITFTPIDFGIPKLGGYRSAKDQHKLYTDGKSKCDGYENISAHQTGSAFDFFAYVDGKASWKPIHLAQVWGAIHAAGRQLNVDLEWGGNWVSFQDMPHVQKKGLS